MQERQETAAYPIKLQLLVLTDGLLFATIRNKLNTVNKLLTSQRMPYLELWESETKCYQELSQ